MYIISTLNIWIISSWIYICIIFSLCWIYDVWNRYNVAITGTNILLGSGSGHTAQQIFFKFCPELSRSLTVTNFFKNLSRLCHGFKPWQTCQGQWPWHDRDTKREFCVKVNDRDTTVTKKVVSPRNVTVIDLDKVNLSRSMTLTNGQIWCSACRHQTATHALP